MIKKIIITTIASMFFSSIITFANVDSTSIATFKYDCTKEGGILYTNFALGGHHHYQRYYKIDLPGIIEIADSTHTTISKNLGVKIGGCNLPKYNNCSISDYGKWYVVSDDFFLSLLIKTKLDITSSGSSLYIDGSSKRNNDEDIIINYSGKNSGSFNFKGSKVRIDKNHNGLYIYKDGEEKYGIAFNNNKYGDNYEYYYKNNESNNIIEINHRIFKQTNSGTVKSSSNNYDEFAAFKGENTEGGLPSDPNAKGPGYVTGLNYWDHTQHIYTTTKVKIHSIDLSCSLDVYSNGETGSVKIISPAGNLDGIKSPKFGGKVLINGKCQKNKLGICDTNSGMNMYLSGGISVSGLEYLEVGKIAGNYISIDSVSLNIKKEDNITYLSKKIPINPKDTIGDFGNLNFGKLDIVKGDKYLIQTPGRYIVDFVFYSKGEQMGSYTFPLNVYSLPRISGVICDGIDSNNSSSGKVSCFSNLITGGFPDEYLDYRQTTMDGVLPAILNNESISNKYDYTDNGTYTVSVSGKDSDGIILLNGASKTFKIDTSKPSINSSFDFNKWYRKGTLNDIVFLVKDQISSTTDNEEAGLSSLEVKVNGQTVSVSGFNTTNNTSAVNVTLSKTNLLSKIIEKSDNTITLKAIDKVGFVQEVTYYLDYDNTAPGVLSFDDTNSDWRNQYIITNVTTSDSLSLLNTTRFKIGSDLNTDCSDGTTTAPTLSDIDGTYTVYVCSKDNAGNISRKNQIYRIDKTKPTLSATDTDNAWKQGNLYITLNTIDPLGSSATEESGLIYSKYSWNTPCSETVRTKYINGQTITYDTEGRHTLYLCNGDIAGNTNTWTSGLYLIDKTNPKTTLDSISNLKKAGINNISINTTIFDDDGKQDTIDLYGENHDVSYQLTIKGPHQTGYTGEVIDKDSVNIVESGSLKNNTKLNKTFSLTLAGKYTIAIKLTDKSGRVYNESKTITIYPSDLDQTKTTISVNSNGDKYANDSDYYTYTLNLKDAYGNAIYSKIVDSINQECGMVIGCKTIKTNMTGRDPSGNDAIIEYGYTGVTTDSDGKISFRVKSLSPGEFKERFMIQMNNWGDNYQDITSSTKIEKNIGNNSFKKPFIVSLKVLNDETTYDAKPEVGTTQKYKFELTKKSDQISYSSGTIATISSGNITMGVAGHFWKNFGGVDYSFGNDYKDYLGFTARIDATSNAIKAPVLNIGKMQISYKLGGQDVSYILNSSDSITGSDSNGNIVSLTGEDKKTLGLKVIGTLQGEGKSSETGQKSNFSDISKSDLRTQIRKNAYNYISSMSSGQIVNGVKYIVGDTELSGDISGYETLVVKDGNVTITGDLNTAGKKLGIIVLKDGYNVDSGYNGEGNVYVKPNVKTINAIIYADGGFISVDSNGNVLSEDNDIRTSILQKQLTLNGTLFTRNTIGGALLGSTNKYTLPGGQETNSFDNAMIYDINYIRRGNKESQNGETDYFIVKYDSSTQSNPPKLFGN